MIARGLLISAFSAVVTVLLLCTSQAIAGTYLVDECSAYGNTAPIFGSWTDSEHFNTSNECMQGGSNGTGRSLEINNSSSATIYQGKSAHWIAYTPSPEISIVSAYTPPGTVLVDCSLQSDGFGAQYFWSGGSQSIGYTGGCGNQGYGYGTEINGNLGPSSYFGWGVTCYASTCSTSSSAGAVLGVQGIRLTAEENSAPWMLADGSNNLWYQDGHWVRGGGWPVGFTTEDPSGVCATDLWINGAGTSTDNSNDTNPDTSSFTQCPGTLVLGGTLDTTAYPNGPLTITYAARNAAGVLAAPNNTLEVDNTPVRLSLSSPNDADPNIWVNHSVRVVAAATAGPSGVGGTNCTTNDGATYSYPSNGVTLDGTGVWTVFCSSWNDSYDASGQRATADQSVTVHIDETPPSISFEAGDPSDPQSIVADTTDGQSGVAGGQIQMRPSAGGSWSPLATQLDGSRLVARFDDATLPPGQWLVQATSCDNAGNCASRQESLNLPVRTGSVSSVGFVKLKALSGRAAGCSQHSGRSRRRRRDCDKSEFVLLGRDRVGLDKPVQIRGRLTTAQGAPIGGAPISVLTAANNGLWSYSQVATATTDSGGVWTAMLPPGPSRILEAVYGGSPTVQPSQSWAGLTVPASLKVLRVWPRDVRWGGKVHIEAKLVGGYLPPEGALVRLRLGYGNAKITYGVKEHVGGDGIFEVTNTFGPGPASLTLRYWLQECTLPEGDYPFAPACGPRDSVSVGGRGG